MTAQLRVGFALVAIVTLMLLETWLSRRNERQLRAAGAIEAAGDVYALMQIAYPLAFLLPAIEGWSRARLPPAAWIAGLLLFVSAKALKYCAIAALGRAWSFRVLVVPRAPLVTTGPYRFLRHPNYVAVAGEIAGGALLTGGWISGTVAVLAFSGLMLARVRVEERALAAAGRNVY